MSTSSGWLMAKATARANEFGGNRILVGLAHPFRDHRIGDGVGQLGRDRARRDDGGADVVGLDLLPQSFGKRAHGVFGRRVNGPPGPTLWPATDDTLMIWPLF